MSEEPRISEDTDEDCTCPSPHPHLDEFVARNVTVHFEAMGNCSWWIGITDEATGRSWAINCGSVSGRAKGYANVEEVTA